MKQVMFIINSFNKRGGLERVVKLKTDSLSNKYICNLLIMYNLGKNAYKISKKINIIYLNKNFKKVRESLIDNILRLRKIIKKNNVKVIIIEGRSVNFIPLLSKLVCKVKVIFVDHGSISGYKITAITKKQKFCNFLDQFLISKLSDKIITLTEKEKNEYIKSFGFAQEKVDCIYNFIDDNLLFSEFSYNNTMKIMTVGRIEYDKGIEELIEVAKLVFSKHPDWQWHIYGDGKIEYINKIIKILKDNRLEDNIILMGKSNNIYELYNNYSLFVMTSHHEGLPMVLLEAKAKKLPIVSFDINSGPSDIVRDGIDGFLIKPFDCQKMADKICELIENPELRQKFSDNAHGNIDKFSKEKIIKQWCDLIDELS